MEFYGHRKGGLMGRLTLSQRAGRYITIFRVVNLIAALVLMAAVGLAIVRPECQRLWTIDIGIIGAVAIWWAGLVWRAIRAMKG